MRPRENATTGSIVVANCLFVIILSRFASCGIVLSAFVRSPLDQLLSAAVQAPRAGSAGRLRGKHE